MVRINNVEISDKAWEVLIDLQARLTKQHKKKINLAKVTGKLIDKLLENYVPDDYLDDYPLVDEEAKKE